MTIGQELLTLRQRRGLSLQALYELSGGELPTATVSKIERGERYPSLRTLEALASTLEFRITIDPRETVIEPL